MFKKLGLLCFASAMATSAWAQPISELLEQAAYQEEAVGDLQSAAELYEKVVATHQSDRAAAAKALYRLSVCYKRLGLHDQSRDALNTLVKEYPQQTLYTTKAQQDLRDADSLGLTLDAVPWQDGETLRYALKGHGGASLGLLEYTATNRVDASQSLWDIEAYTVLALTDHQMYLHIEAEEKGFTPQRSRVEGNQVGMHATSYSESAIAASTNGQGTGKSIPTEGSVFDNEQVLHLLRRLPLKEGYQTKLTVFENVSKSVSIGDLKVEGVQHVKVAAGSFDTYKVNLQFSGGNHPAPKVTFWIAKDEARQVVKFENQFFMAELMNFGSERVVSRQSYSLKEAQLSLQAPEGWRFFDVESPSPHYDAYLYAIPPEMGAWALFITKFMDTASVPDMNIEQVVAGDLQAIKGFLKGYTLRDNNPFDRDKAVLPARSFIGDYIHNDQNMVEYRTYLLGKKGIYWFVFRVEAEKFDKYRPQFDALIDSFEAV